MELDYMRKWVITIHLDLKFLDASILYLSNKWIDYSVDRMVHILKAKALVFGIR